MDVIEQTMMAGCIAVSLCVVVILVLVWIGWNCSAPEYEKFITGMWKGDSAFCESSGMSSMLLYIGEPSHNWRRTTRDCHLIINNDITCQAVKITYKRGSTGWCRVGKYRILCDLEFDEDPVMPEKNLTFDFDMATGKLCIHCDGTLYGLLYRDNELTDMADAVDKDSDTVSA